MSFMSTSREFRVINTIVHWIQYHLNEHNVLKSSIATRFSDKIGNTLEEVHKNDINAFGLRIFL